jgi:hypothetical protein
MNEQTNDTHTFIKSTNSCYIGIVRYIYLLMENHDNLHARSSSNFNDETKELRPLDKYPPPPP